MFHIVLLLVTEGFGASVLINGFPVYLSGDSTPERLNERITPYVKSGINQIKIVLDLNASTPREDQTFKLRLIAMEVGQTPDDGLELVTYQWQPTDEPAIEAGAPPVTVLSGEFNIARDIGPWRWESLVGNTNPRAIENEVYRYYEQMAKAFAEGNTASILDSLALRFREIGSAMGVPYERMQAGFGGSLQRLTSAEDFAVSLVERDKAIFLWDEGNRWCTLVRPDRKSAIQLTSDGITQPFELTVSYIDGQIVTIR